MIKLKVWVGPEFLFFFFNDKSPILVDIQGIILISKIVEGGSSATAVMMAVFDGWPVLVLTLIMAALSGIIMWALDSYWNPEEFPHSFFRGTWEGFWWAFVSMTTVGWVFFYYSFFSVATVCIYITGTLSPSPLLLGVTRHSLLLSTSRWSCHLPIFYGRGIGFQTHFKVCRADLVWLYFLSNRRVKYSEKSEKEWYLDYPPLALVGIYLILYSD